MSKQSSPATYDKNYFVSSNYYGYDGIAYRSYHFVRYVIVGFYYKFWLHTKSILDVGCATGMSVWVFRTIFGMEAYGIDISRYANAHRIASVKKFCYVANIGKRGVHFPRRTFDLIVSYDTLEHLSEGEVRVALDNMFRLTRRAIFGIYVLDEGVARLHTLIDKAHPDHLSEHPASWWRRLFLGKGFRVSHLPGARKGSFMVTNL